MDFPINHSPCRETQWGCACSLCPRSRQKRGAVATCRACRFRPRDVEARPGGRSSFRQAAGLRHRRPQLPGGKEATERRAGVIASDVAAQSTHDWAPARRSIDRTSGLRRGVLPRSSLLTASTPALSLVLVSVWGRALPYWAPSPGAGPCRRWAVLADGWPCERIATSAERESDRGSIAPPDAEVYRLDVRRVPDEPSDFRPPVPSW
jgi:hypothetical protein